MNRIFIAALLLLVLLSACNQEISRETPPATLAAMKIPLPVTQTPENVAAVPETVPVTAPPVDRVELNIQQLDPIPPEDILEEIMFYVGGGNGPCPDPNAPKPYIDPEWGDPQDTVLTFESEMIVCRLAPGVPLDITITYPDGRTVQQHIEGTNGVYFLHLRPRFDDPEGIYTIRVTQNNELLETNVFYHEPTIPIVVHEQDQGELQLYNFLPGENITLLLYHKKDDYTLDFAGSEEFVTDGSGELILQVPKTSEYHYIVMNTMGVEFTDRRSVTFAHEDQDLAEQNWLATMSRNDGYRTCPPNVSSQLLGKAKRWAPAQILGTVTTLYANPRTTSRPLTNLYPGSDLNFWTSTPYCAEGLIWWEVWGQSHGYVPERDPTGNLLLGIAAPEPAACSEPAGRLAAGSWARVTFTDGKPMNIRLSPGLGADVATGVPEGTRVWLLEGPQCRDQIRWWRIRTDSGTEGWMAEYTGRVYLLEP